MGVELGHAKFQPSTPKRTFSNWAAGKMCVFNEKLAIFQKR